jgi:hypothetical protein
LEKTLDAHDTSVRELEAQLHGVRAIDIVDLNLRLIEACSRRAKVANTLQRRRAALGAEAKADLAKMKKDLYLTVRLNARAVKTRIRDRLRQRKFELERLERSYRTSINGACIFDFTAHT